MRPRSLIRASFIAMALVVLIAPTASVAATPTTIAQGSQAEGYGSCHTVRTSKALRLHDQMRLLWIQHVEWTRMSIIAFAAGSAGFDANAARLIKNQADIGNASKPYFGDAAGDHLTALLEVHISTAVEILRAAKAGDTAALDDAISRWYANANEIADFLASLNPESWSRGDMRRLMTTHLDQTLVEATAELTGDYAASASQYDEIEAHILVLADELSGGIICAFPRMFR